MLILFVILILAACIPPTTPPAVDVLHTATPSAPSAIDLGTLIRSLIRRHLGDTESINKIVVDTVERMQGQEREVIIVSFTTASAKFAAQMADFLFQPQRLNVAITRPRTKLILVGSHHMLKADQFDETKKETLDMIRDLISSCHHITVPNGALG